MKGDELNFREAMVMLLATAMMYGGAAFVLVFDSAVLGILAAAINFIFWVWVAGFFVFFGKDTFPKLSFKTRLILSLFFWLIFCSERFKSWANNEFLAASKNDSCT